MADLISVQEARERMLAGISYGKAEHVELAQAGGRVLAEALVSKRDQPPFNASSMDGYAVRFADVDGADPDYPKSLTVVGESAAGHAFSGAVDGGFCVRIFTGAPLPEGTDSVVAQEDVRREGNTALISDGGHLGRFVRPAGFDFQSGQEGLAAGRVLDPRAVSLAAAMNHPRLPVRTKPRVALLASGDELVLPGHEPGPSQIIASNTFGVAQILQNAGAETFDLGIALDTMADLNAKLQSASDSDIVVTLGGASVGDHDLLQDALKALGVDLSFWSIAMKPGKPVMFGTSEAADGRTVCYVGLPGNPVSSLVCSMVFLVPMIRKMLGLPHALKTQPAKLAIDMPSSGGREEYMRASMEWRDGEAFVTPFASQDSSLLSVMAKADCLMIRLPNAPSSKAGEPCRIIPL